jgi:asparagine synthase (glutamine-hydrolysing)
VWRDGHWQQRRYWDLAEYFLAPRLETRGDEETLNGLETLLREATARRLHSDVPLGAFLSGGVDSSTVVALMRRSRAEGLHTFSAEFSNPDFNEGDYSRAAAAHLRTEHHPRLLDVDVEDVLPRMARLMDTPLGDDSAFSTYLLSEWTRKHVTVALSGDGADELFAGYITYRADCLRRWLGPVRHLAAGVFRLLAAVAPERGAKLSRRFQLQQLARGLCCPEAEAHFLWRQVWQPGGHADCLEPDLRATARQYGPADVFRDHYARVRGADWLDRCLYVDCQTWLPDDILIKVDRASMAASLEVRSPFLDHRVVEYAARMPRRLKMRGLRTKVGLRTLARRHLPPAIVDRKKAGFNSPTTDWLRGPLRAAAEEILRDESGALGLRWRGGLEGTWRRFQEGDRRPQYFLWGLLMLGMWHREVLRAARCRGVEAAPGGSSPLAA